MISTQIIALKVHMNFSHSTLVICCLIVGIEWFRLIGGSEFQSLGSQFK